MLASMSEIDPRADLPMVDWSDLGVSGLLPTGTVTLLLADVEGSTPLWESQPQEMAAAVARLNQTVSEFIAAYGGVRPVEQGEGDSFVAAFVRASDAVACALQLQLAPLAPIRLRIGVHTGEDRLRPARPRRTQTTHQWLGLAHPHRARHRPPRQRRAGQQRHRHKAFRLTTHRANPPDPRLHQTWADLACAARPGGSPPRLTAAATTAGRPHRRYGC